MKLLFVKINIVFWSVIKVIVVFFEGFCRVWVGNSKFLYNFFFSCFLIYYVWNVRI